MGLLRTYIVFLFFAQYKKNIKDFRKKGDLVIKVFTKLNAGIIIFVGSVQWLMMLILLESFQPGYNSSLNYVSSLGVGTTSIIYNISIILFGSSLVFSSVILYKSQNSKLFNILLLITGAFVISVGLFPENIRPIHGYVTAFTFIFAVATAILSYKVSKPPFSYISVALGSITLVLMVLFFPYLGLPTESTILFLGLAKGTIERILIYLLMFWMIGFSIYLIK
ncbi:MAG: DUF998 domain-containing protein [Promethearchaeota archaeon]